jgi:hypothetical protein
MMGGTGAAGGAGGGAPELAQPAAKTVASRPKAARRIIRMVPFPRVEFRYLAIEGPPGLGKTSLAERLGVRLNAAVVLDDTANPFLGDFYAGRSGAAFQTQLFFTLARHRQLQRLRQGDLFSQTTICDYLFDRSAYAFTNLDDNELYVYQRR